MRSPGKTRRRSRRASSPILPIAAVVVALLFMAGCGGSTKTSAGAPATAAAGATTATTATNAKGNRGMGGDRLTTTDGPTTASPPAASPSGQEGVPPAGYEGQPSNEKVELASRVVPAEGAIPARYTCDGQDIAPQLSWETPPPGTVELMLDIIKIKPVNNRLYFAWAITGIKPNVHELNPPKLPSGVIVGQNSDRQVGYNLCPPKHTTEDYVAVIFALPRHLAAKPGFNATSLRLQAEKIAYYESLYIFHYTRH